MSNPFPHRGYGDKHGPEPKKDLDGGRFTCHCECCQGDCEACEYEWITQQQAESDFYRECVDQGMNPLDAKQALYEKFYAEEEEGGA